MNYVVYKYLMIGSMVGGVACMAAILAYSFRGVLRRLLEKWLKLGPVGRMLSLLFFTVGVLFGGSKNDVQG